VLTIDHEHRDVQFGQLARHQLAQRGLSLAHEPARDRRLAHRFLCAADLFTDRLGGTGVAAGGQPGQHPLHHHLGEQVLAGEMLIAGQRHLVSVDGACPWPGHRRPAPAQGDRTATRAVAHRGPLGVVLALGPACLADFGLKHRGHHRQPGGHAHRQQPLPGRTSDVGHRQLDLLRQIGKYGSVGRVSQANCRYGLHGGPLLLFVVFLVVHPKTYHPVGLR